MMANKLPFWMLPASWGLTGKSKLRAKAEYELTGVELTKELARIDIDNDIDAQVSDMDIDVEAGTLTQSVRDKKVAELRDEPWVEVKHMQVNPEDVKQGYMELDWNDQFVAMLHAQGYTGESDESIVNKWFNDICRTVLLQENADMDFGLQDAGNPDVIKVRNNPEEGTDGIDE